MDKKNIKAKKLANLFRFENVPLVEAMHKLDQLVKDSYTHEEIYGEYAPVIQYINSPIKKVYEYLANADNIQQWTYSLRNLKRIKKNFYVAADVLLEDTDIYVQIKANPKNYTIEHHCAWDQGKDLWMRYYFYLLDAKPALKKPGTIMMWLNCKHPYYYLTDETQLPKHIVKSRNKANRRWVGEYWKYFPAMHQLEAKNVKTILER